VTGTLALHGGGEFLPGDEACLDAMLAAAPRHPDGVIRVAVVPTAAARGRPELAAANGVHAFQAAAARAGVNVQAHAVLVVDGASAADPALVAMLADADLVHLPGGDPDLIPAVLPGTAAWTAIQDAQTRGAVLAGASAGAMALAGRCWTPAGVVRGLDLVPDVLVVPHADATSWPRTAARFGDQRPPGVGALGLAERTAVLRQDGGWWLVVGEGEARWAPAGTDRPRVVQAGDRLRLDDIGGGG
jgi:cyanophycinase-like exopeptidase